VCSAVQKLELFEEMILSVVTDEGVNMLAGGIAELLESWRVWMN